MALTQIDEFIYPADRKGTLLLSPDQSTAANDITRVSVDGQFYDRVIEGGIKSSHCKIYADGTDQSAKFNTALGKAIVKQITFDEPGAHTYTINGTVTIPAGVIIEVKAGIFFTGTGTINGGIWDVDDRQFIWNTGLTVNPEGFASNNISPMLWGMVPNTVTDQSAALQKAINFAANSPKIKRILIPVGGQYNVHDLVIMQSPGSTNSGQVTLTIEGIAASNGLQVILNNTNLQSATFHIQQGYYVVIKNLNVWGIIPFNSNFVTGDWTLSGTVRTNTKTPYCAFAIDDIFTGNGSTLSPSDYYPGVPVSYYNNIQYSGSTNVYIENCNIAGFYVGIANGLSGCPNGENIVWRNGFSSNIAYAWVAGQLQSRENIIEGVYFYYGDTFITNVGFGVGLGDLPSVNNCNLNILKYLFQCQSDFTFVRFSNGYSESIWSLGKSTSNTPVEFINWQLTQVDNTFSSPSTPSSPVFVETHGAFSWIGGKLEASSYVNAFPLSCSTAVFSGGTFIRGNVPFITNTNFFDVVSFKDVTMTIPGGVEGIPLSENSISLVGTLDESSISFKYFLPGSVLKSRTNRYYSNVGDKIDRLSVGAYVITLNANRTASFTPDDAGRFALNDLIVVDEQVNNSGDAYSACSTALGFIVDISGGVVTVSYVPAGFVTATSYTMYIARVPLFAGRSVGSTTSGSNVITNLQFETVTLSEGSVIKGDGIPTGARVQSVNTGAGTVTMSMNATANATHVELYDAKLKVIADTRPFFYFGQFYTVFQLENIWFKGDEVYNLTSIFNLRSYYCTIAGKLASVIAAPTFITVGAAATIITVVNGGSFDNGTGVFTNGLPNGFVMDNDGLNPRLFNASPITYQSNVSVGYQHKIINAIGASFTGDAILIIESADGDFLAPGQSVLICRGDFNGGAGRNIISLDIQSDGIVYLDALAVIPANDNTDRIASAKWVNSRANIATRRAIADTNATLTTSDNLLAYTTLSVTRTVTLPSAASVTNQHFVIKDESGSATGSVKITIVGTVDGASNPDAIVAAYGVKRLYSNGTAYFFE